MIINLRNVGHASFGHFFDDDYISNLAEAVDKSYEICRKVQLINGVDQTTDGTIHHLLATGDPIYVDLLSRVVKSDLLEFIRSYFGGNFIINSYGGVNNLPNKPSYVTNIHRDIRFFSSEIPLMLNMLIMLDDFTLENGATYFLNGSHKQEARPTEEFFYSAASRAVGKRGDVLFFDSNLWHAAGANNTQLSRRALTITFSKPFMKQQLDYCRALGYEAVAKMEEDVQQILGYFSRTPTSLHEWYRKPELRFYRPGQDEKI